MTEMRAAALASLNRLAESIRGLRVLYWGGSGRGFPGGDGPVEATELLPEVGVHLEYTHAGDPDEAEKLAADYDVAIVTNTRVALIQGAPRRIWECAGRTVWWFWDLRPGSVAGPLRGLADHAFLSYDGAWTSPQGQVFEPSQWAQALGCPVHYCPQGAPLREPVKQSSGERVLFIGDLANGVFHRGRAEIARAVGARVLNAHKRDGRLAIERQMPTLYRSARYVLSMSPLAPGYTSVRTYSILACGGLMALHRFPGADALFRDGEHAILFDSAGELKERLDELDGDEDRRERIAAAGRLLHATKHTVAHRVLDICRRVTGASEDFAGWA